MANSQLNFHGINNRATVHCPPGKPPLLKELLEQAENMLVPLKILGLQISGDNPILCAPGDGAENLKEFYSNHSGPLKKWLKPIQSHTISAGTRAHRHLPELGGIFEYNGFTLGFPYELENASRVWFFINAPILSYFTPRKTKRLKKFLEHLATLLLKRDLEILRREHRANQRRQIGVGEMAHQLKTPLTQLEHTLKSLETNGASNVGKVQDGVKKIQQTQNFIRDYLFYLKTPETATSPIAVTKISQELKWYYTHDFARRKIKFTLHNCLAPDTQVNVNYTLIFQVLQNIMDNAFIETPDGGWISLTINESHYSGVQFVQLSISDSGPGVPGSLEDHIFKAHFSTHPGGNGLGLSLSQNIADFYGGKIEYVRANGSLPHKFTLSLPKYLEVKHAA